MPSLLFRFLDAPARFLGLRIDGVLNAFGAVDCARKRIEYCLARGFCLGGCRSGRLGLSLCASGEAEEDQGEQRFH
jgi:hypothetical protein